MRKSILVLGLVIGFVVPGAIGGVPRTEVREYHAGVAGDVTTVCDETASTLVAPLDGTGGSCFTLDGSEWKVHLSVVDWAGWAVSAFFLFEDADNNALAHEGFCHEALADVPRGAAKLWVFTGTVFAPLDCGLRGWGPPTNGVITARFS